MGAKFPNPVPKGQKPPASPAPPPPSGLTITKVCPVCGCAQWRRIDVMSTTPADGPVVLLACKRCGLSKVAL